MGKRNFKYIYGPVASWRLGRSLGIDPLSGKGKVCSFDCVYCQLGETQFLSDERKSFVPAAAIIDEIAVLPASEIDYLTFSGIGEPTLAKNLGEIIRAVRKIRKEKIAVLTNSSLMDAEDVRQDLLLSDLVVAKLDAPSQGIFERVNKPIKGKRIEDIVGSLKKFKDRHAGRLALQIMFIEQNRGCADEMARIAREIGPDEVQINTPLRPCRVKPLSRQEMAGIKRSFEGLNVLSVYEAETIKVEPVSREDTLKRRGKI